MASTSFSFEGYYPMPSQPIAMPQKTPDYLAAYDTVDYRLSGSPPEAPDSGTTSGITSYDPSAASASYAASASDFDGSSVGTSSIDLLEFMNERLQTSYDPTPMDTSLVQQAQA
jgi:hypothetical protein